MGTLLTRTWCCPTAQARGQEPTFSIGVRTLDGEFHTISGMRAGDSLRALRLAVSEELGVGADWGVVLISGTQTLEDSSATLGALKLGSGSELCAVRSMRREISVILDKTSGERLGIDVDVSDRSTLLIDAVTGGLAQLWNEMNKDTIIKPGDRVVEVNGIRGDAFLLVDECKQDKKLEIILKRRINDSKA